MKKIALVFILSMIIDNIAIALDFNINALNQPTDLKIEKAPTVSEEVLLNKINSALLSNENEIIPRWLMALLSPFIIVQMNCCKYGDCCEGGIIPSNNGTTTGLLKLDFSKFDVATMQTAGVSYDRNSGKLVLARDLQVDRSVGTQKLFVQAGTYFVIQGQEINVTLKVL